MKKEYSLLELHIIRTFTKSGHFTFRGKRFRVLAVGKPRPQGNLGECKTDVFVRGQEISSGVCTDFKISVKNRNKEFLGNKLKQEDLEAYFGSSWEQVIRNATAALQTEFEQTPLLYPVDKYPVRANSATVGWKLEITDKPRRLSIPVPLTVWQIKDYIYKGTNLTSEKKNAVVGGSVIPNSGVADFLLVTTIEEIKNAQDIIAQMQLIDTLPIGGAFFAFTANNYRLDTHRADGPRWLAVCVRWDCCGGRLVPTYLYDHPLHYTGQYDMAPYVQDAMTALGKRSISELVPGRDADAALFSR